MTASGAAAPAGRPRVVIVGGGFGGLEAAKGLARAPVEIIILDRQNHHCFQPLLYQVATAALSPADVAWPIRSILRNQANILVLMAEVTGIDTGGRRVIAGQASFGYDFLVLATGVTHSYFGHDGWATFAPGLKRIEDATDIRARILLAFERAELTEDAAEQRRLLSFVVIGGGPTGVEMAGAMAEVAHHALSREFRRFAPEATRIVLLEAGPRILPTFPEDLSAYAERALRRLGVEVRTSAKVTDCDAGGVEIGTERIEAGVMMWAAGVTASPAAKWLGAAHDRAGRVRVNADLSVPGLDNVYVIGDTAAVPDSIGPVPGTAPAAKQMGQHVARTIAARVEGGSTPGAFAYRHRGDLAAIGRKAAVVKLGRLQLTGFVAWVFWGVAHIYFLIGLRQRVLVAVNWLWEYLTFRRGARLITRAGR